MIDPLPVETDAHALLKLIPTTWLDPLLTGPTKVIGEPPYTGADIENLLRAVKERLRAALGARMPPPEKEPQ